MYKTRYREFAQGEKRDSLNVRHTSCLSKISILSSIYTHLGWLQRWNYLWPLLVLRLTVCNFVPVNLHSDSTNTKGWTVSYKYWVRECMQLSLSEGSQAGVDWLTTELRNIMEDHEGNTGIGATLCMLCIILGNIDARGMSMRCIHMILAFSIGSFTIAFDKGITCRQYLQSIVYSLQLTEILSPRSPA